MTVKEFYEKYNEIKLNAIKHQGSMTYDIWEDKEGNRASSYDGGFYQELTYNNETYVCKVVLGQEKISKKS